MPTDEVAQQVMPSDDEIVRVLSDPPGFAQAVEVITQIRVGREQQISSAAGLNVAARFEGRDRAEYWLEKLKAYGCLETFVLAMRARNLLLQQSPRPVPADSDSLSSYDTNKLGDFLLRLESFRCLIQVDGETKGSGILVGPNSVLTAWHVIAKKKPALAQKVLPKIHVVLADGRKIAVVKLSASSPCADVEWPPSEGRAPSDDIEALDHHDVALLHLYKPAGIHLSYAALASPPYAFRGPLGIVLVSHPQGEWQGVEFAKLQKLQNLTVRWAYNVTDNRPGSSGGGCFDNQFVLVGIHQGRWQGYGRMVPLICFYHQVQQAIVDDELPPLLWSLDGSSQSHLIVARDDFFIGYQAAMRGPPRVRGLWVQRMDLTHDQSGLPFSYQILSSLVERSPDTRLMRVSFDSIVHDLPQEIARRAEQAGLTSQAPAPQAGAGVDQTEPEAMVADRARRIALSLNDQAHALGIRLWVFFDHPSVVFGDEPRWALTAFVDQAMRLDNLRIALAGFEAVQMPGVQFDAPGDALGEGAPGLMVEYLGDLNADDVRQFIKTATRDLKRPISKEFTEEWVEEALEDLQPVNGRYDSVVRSTIAERLQKRLQKLSRRGAQI